MGFKTDISWTHHTHNLWEGCHKVSEGCKNCYAEAMNAWLRGGEHWGPVAPRLTFKPEHYDQPLKWNKVAEEAGERRRVFCGSVMDILEIHPLTRWAIVQEELRRDLFQRVIPQTPALDWILLTKRIENAARILPWIGRGERPPDNVILGVTVENEDRARERIHQLRTTPAAKRLISYEPALGPVDWRTHLPADGSACIDVVIFGDESGRRKRPAELQWAREARDACEAANVLFHFKQWCGADAPGIEGERDEKRKIHLPVLDGRRHAEMP